MITIRPVSDLRNKFTEIEDCVKSGKGYKVTKLSVLKYMLSG